MIRLGLRLFSMQVNDSDMQEGVFRTQGGGFAPRPGKPVRDDGPQECQKMRLESQWVSPDATHPSAQPSPNTPASTNKSQDGLSKWAATGLCACIAYIACICRSYAGLLVAC